jgi:hypothetical protein
MQVPTIVPSEPCKDKNVEACIDQAEGDATLIDAVADALVMPETFQPTCQLTFTPLVKGGLIAGVFGWYNVKEDPANPGKFLKPGANDYFAMFRSDGFKTGAELAAEQMGQKIVLDLEVERQAGRYKGGQIGFFLASDGANFDPVTHKLTGGNYLFHTQHALNKGGSDATPFYNVLTWESVAHENTFYFGWEDLPPGSPIDYDFDDWLFSVEGVQCGGGGQPCDTGKQGVCAAGVLQCKKGVIQCVQSIPEGAETCNALDDDCDGSVDNGENLCDADRICFRGQCVPRCGTGEFRCGSDAMCVDGLCVDKGCADVTCPEGQVCLAGQCADACTGITCPHDRVCRNGGCVDPCIGIECDPGFSCVLGVCSSCECSSCGDGQMCSAVNGTRLCVDNGCETMNCAAGQHCTAGACVDNCDGAVCPQGQTCTAGECVADGSEPNPGTGGSGTGGTDVVIGPLGGSSNSTGSTGGTSNGSGGKGGGNKLVPSEPACGCALPGAGGDARSALLLLTALAAFASRKRRGKRAA